ncbi:glycosyltransferase [Hyphomicrobium sp.]|uniref:glycosyltransferase n=1 Tax=Hyphomicrobium sp. TaxID=82 RepID=UPI002FDF38F0
MAERYQLVVYGCSNAQNRLTVNGWIDKYYARPERFVILNYVSDSDLVELYNLCELFVFPSWHEGFGLPALEAMQSGAATIAADATSLPEVLGRRDALFDPFDVASIAGKIAQVLFDDTLRADLAAHGLQQARTFSWDDTARKAIEAVEEAVRKHKIRAVPQEKIYRTVISQIGKVQGPGSAPEDADLITLAGSIDSNMAAACRLQRPLELPKQLTWRVEGPFDSSYSLALLNRETARALKGLGHEVALHSTEGPGDFPPTQAFLEANPDLAELHARSQRISPQISDVVSRNLYPPRVFDMEGAVNLLHHYAWEETGFPSEWAEEFNTHLNGVACLSSHVEKILVDHGVACHLEVSGCGTDHWERVEPDGDFVLDTKRSFRFLHVSSCFPRKGVDLLLKAYGSSFSSGDDVVLVIKTFPNPHNEIHGWLGQAKVDNPSYPDVLIIEDDLTDSALKSLYRQCNALVAPSKAEGYGLPMAEAMLSGLPVITTAWGGQRDFCDEETAWLVDYEFELAQSHFGLFDSVWARPSVEDLAATMRTLFDLPAAKRRKRADRGRERLLANSRWIHVAERLEKITRHAVIEPSSVRPRVGWVSAWNTRCGIASYSEHLLDNMSSDITVLAPANQPLEQADGQNVLRCWQTNGHDDLENLRASVEENDFDVIIVQFNYGFFSFDALGRFIEYMLNRGRTVIVTLHATSDPQGDAEWGRQKRLELLREPLSRCSRLLVHTVEDLNRLKGLGLVDNVVLFPHGILDFNSESRTLEDGVFTVATYGFFLPHKGLLETIEAISILKERGLPVRLRMMNAEYPVLISAELIMRAKALIKERGLEDIVRLDTSFLSVHESLRRLGDTDLIVFPYQQTGESSSAAVRYGLAVGRPVAVTPLPIFQDVSPLVLDLPGLTAVDIANGIEQLRKELINDPECYRRMKPDADRWRETHRYSHLGRRLDGMIVALHRKRKRSAVSAC